MSVNFDIVKFRHSRNVGGEYRLVTISNYQYNLPKNLKHFYLICYLVTDTKFRMFASFQVTWIWTSQLFNPDDRHQCKRFVEKWSNCPSWVSVNFKSLMQNFHGLSYSLVQLYALLFQYFCPPILQVIEFAASLSLLCGQTKFIAVLLGRSNHSPNHSPFLIYL